MPRRHAGQTSAYIKSLHLEALQCRPASPAGSADREGRKRNAACTQLGDVRAVASQTGGAGKPDGGSGVDSPRVAAVVWRPG